MKFSFAILCQQNEKTKALSLRQDLVSTSVSYFLNYFRMNNLRVCFTGGRDDCNLQIRNKQSYAKRAKIIISPQKIIDTSS